MSQNGKSLKGYCPINQKEGGKDIKEVPTQREHRVGQTDNVEALLGKPMESQEKVRRSVTTDRRNAKKKGHGMGLGISVWPKKDNHSGPKEKNILLGSNDAPKCYSDGGTYYANSEGLFWAFNI
ncbi:unnamed protein product [Prunus armeniaca]|uniref:Uncharacterized protein n=1 Tax=Prunus armeniaca TaxID=36596 RepID=A0A6J5TH34_PRUAR|nr:unnamed protein product [Prunus armeniaca]CAB4293979.1 unnamed protein product [Prunus armeniaca]